MSAPSLSVWADAKVVLQCECSADADITPQKPGDPDQPNVRRKSMTANSPTVQQKVMSLVWVYSNVPESVRHVSLAHQSALGQVFLSQADLFREEFRQRFCAQALRHVVGVSVCIQSSFCLSVLRLA